MYHSSHQLDIRHSYFADLHDIAHTIQSSLECVLREPDAGVYLPNQLEPVMRAGCEYWYQQTVTINQASQVTVVQNELPPLWVGNALQTHNQPWQYYRYHYIRVENFEAALSTPFDVVEMAPGFRPPYFNPHEDFPGTDAQPRATVLPHHRAHEATLAPTLPWAGIKIAHQMIENEIASSRVFDPQPRKMLEEIIMPFVSETYLNLGLSDRAKIEHLQTDQWFHRTINGIFESMLLVLHPIRNALRNNGYQMCVVNYLDGYQLRIDQLGDHRIHEWERITRDPAYQRFLQAKADGSWDRFVSEQDENHAQRLAHEPPSIYR